MLGARPDVLRSLRVLSDLLWRTADGTTIITSSYHNEINSFVVPQHLLEPRDQALELLPQSVIPLPEPTSVVSSAPYFALDNPDTHHVLVACRDHPLQILRALSTDRSDTGSLFSYPLISPQTEAYLPVHSLVWPAPNALSSPSFFVGSNNLIAQFNINYIGKGPQQWVPTIPSKRHLSKGNGVGMRGVVSALSFQNKQNHEPVGLLAAATWTRCLGLYDFARGGQCTSTWSIASAAESAVVSEPAPEPGQRFVRKIRPDCPRSRKHRGKGIGGAGIVQTAWSPDGRFLLVNERQSTGILVYDVRVTSTMLAFLAGRDALTHQRLDLAVYPDLDGLGGFEVWAGTKDGTVQVWQGVGKQGGCIWPSWDFPTTGVGATTEQPAGSPVGSVSLHPHGSVVAACSGCWSVPDYDEANSTLSSPSPASNSDDSDSAPSDTSSMSNMLHRQVRTLPDNKTFAESTLALWSIGTSKRNDTDSENMDLSRKDACHPADGRPLTQHGATFVHGS